MTVPEKIVKLAPKIYKILDRLMVQNLCTKPFLVSVKLHLMSLKKKERDV